MLKKRIGGAVIIKDGIVVQSIGFGKYLPIGKPEIVVEYLNKWGIDEITLFDISATKKNKCFDSQLLRDIGKKSFVPLAVGGGISSILDIDNLIKNGADKVCINHLLQKDLSVLKKGAEKYGDQCMIAVVDFTFINNDFFVYDYVTKSATKIKVADWVKILEDSQAGEILLNSVDRDGTYKGFDINLFATICDNIAIPIIALGGAGCPLHFKELFLQTEVAAAYAGNFFNFSEHSVITLKKELIASGFNIRLETAANYSSSVIDKNNRIEKRNDTELEHLLFTKIEKEII